MAKRKDDDEELDVEQQEEEFEPKPKKRTGVTGLTLILIVLNVLAAAGFVFLLAMDYAKRQAWSYAVFKHDLAMVGLPLEDEAKGPSASRVTFPKITLSSEQIKKSYSSRGGKGVSEPFTPVVLTIDNTIQPQHLTADILKDVFQGVGEPVKTLEDEVKKVQGTLPGEIANSADGILTNLKNEADKRNKLEDTILRLAYSVQQIDALEGKLKKIPAGELDSRLKDAAQRRMLYDVLAPLDFLRPAQLDDRILEKIANFDSEDAKLENYFKLLDRRLGSLRDAQYDRTLFFGKEWSGQQRDSMDKRQAIATTLFVIGQAKKPDGTPLLNNDRLLVIIGLYQFALGAQNLTGALLAMNERIIDAIMIDRDGSMFEDKGKIEKNPGFVLRYQREIQRMQDIVEVIKKHKNRIAELQDQLKEHQEVVKERKEQVKAVVDKLVAQKQVTKTLMEEADKLRKQVFDAQRRLLTAQQKNLELVREIARWEGQKGGKAP